MLIIPLRIFTALVVAAVGVCAQDPCIIDCLQESQSPSTCTLSTNLTCVCSNKDFQSAAYACLEAKCTAAELQSAMNLQQAECDGGSSSST